MGCNYIGHLPGDDPLHGYLQACIAPCLGLDHADKGYNVYRFSHSRGVYLYEGMQTRTKVVGKFFNHHKSGKPGHIPRTAEDEFNNLSVIRGAGLASLPNYVVRPLGCNPDIGSLLVLEYLEGDILSRIIDDAIYRGRHARLFRKLSALAQFLAAMHNWTAGGWTVDFNENCGYMERLIGSLAEKRGLGREHSDEFHHLKDIWRGRGVMWEDRAVIVHGDATPANFIFGRGRDVMGIDFERMRWTDRVFDLGRLCGELKHFFYRGTGNPHAAEPFIGHFLWEYCTHFPDRDAAFRSITRRIPFYMGITLLRIARNSWIGQDYRWRLIHEARNILRAQT